MNMCTQLTSQKSLSHIQVVHHPNYVWSLFDLLKGYQEADINIDDPETFKFVVDERVLDKDGVLTYNNNIVFAPEGTCLKEVLI